MNRITSTFALALVALTFSAATNARASTLEPATQLSSQAMNNAENATVLITGYMDVVSGCPLHGTGPTRAFEVASCSTNKDSSVTRLWYRCAGVAEGLQDAGGRSIGVLTARHCIDPTKEMSTGETTLMAPETRTISVHFRDGDTGTYVGEAVGFLQNYDVALIRVDARHPHTAVAQPEFAIAPGEPLHVLGHSHETNWGWKGASSFNGTKGSPIPDWTYTSMVVCPQCNDGDSGAGVWSSDGKLVGIFNAVTAQYGLFTSSQRIKQLTGIDR
jgi:Trypsin-like peptidase domain